MTHAAVATALAAALLAPFAAADETAEALSASERAALQTRLVELAHEATPKTVMVRGLIGLGTGARVRPDGTVYTNAHVAAGARYAILMYHDGTRVMARRTGIDFDRDLAVLVPVDAPAEPLPHFTPATERPKPGTWVAALGYPGGPRGDAMPTFTAGRITSGGGLAQVSGFLDYSAAMRSDAPLYSGNSGGPLVGLGGELVGINGAVDIGAALGEGGLGSLTIPIDDVLARTRALTGGVIRLPGDVTLDPDTNPLVGWLEQELDPWIQELMQAQLDGGEGASPNVTRDMFDGLAKTSDRRKLGSGAVKSFTEGARRSLRNRLLLATMDGALAGKRSHAVLLKREDGTRIPGTRVLDLGIVTAEAHVTGASGVLRDATSGRWEVVARSDEHGLALLRRVGAAPLTTDHASPAPHAPPVGSFVAVAHADGPVSAGVLSAAPRPIPADLAQLLMSGQQQRMQRLMRGLLTAVEVFGSDELAELAKQTRNAMDLRNGFSAGVETRGFAKALSFDAPIDQSSIGAPLVTADGELVGVITGRAHHGTAYAVPVATIIEAFVPSADDG
jgi:S1-C subfamily serine protease